MQNNSGTSKVRVSTALPAGTNNIGDVDVLTLPALPAGTNNIGDVDVLTVPTDPFGANADAASATGSISAKLRFIAATGIPVTSLPAIPAGNNNIGDVDVVTQPARAATTDTITAKLATDAIQNGTTALTPKFAAIAAATSGNNTLVAAVTSKKIRILALFVVAGAANNIYFDDGAGTLIIGGSTNKIQLAANGGFVLPFNPVGWGETAATQALRANLSAATSVSGVVVYVEV